MKTMLDRGAGILMPVSSLPSPYGIGTFGKAAYEFVDFLKKARQKYWQVLPVGPTSYGDSPYQSFSAFAGNPYFIDLEMLVKQKLLTRKEVNECDLGDDPQDIDYGKQYENRMPLLKKAYRRSLKEEDPAFAAFRKENDIFEGASWDQWAEDIRYRWDNAMYYYRENYAEEIGFYAWLQYLFFREWKALKSYANEKGVEIIGDIPIYVAYDSADVWAHPELFQLNGERKPSAVAGCPPDGFSATGQLWGNPLYNWEVHRQSGFDWWIKRIEHCFSMYDIVRIDHFRGFDEYYAIPFGDKTAENGWWEKGPGMDLFRAVSNRLGERAIIAEDLGFMTDSVIQLVEDSGYPNMKVIEFAFDERDTGNASDYLPHNYTENSVAYTGTHDNETLIGYFKPEKRQWWELQYIADYLGAAHREEVPDRVFRAAYGSVASVVIFQAQDVLKLDNWARMNTPGTVGSNWRWRMRPGELNQGHADHLAWLVDTFGRF